jgi:FkbH-like protein
MKSIRDLVEAKEYENAWHVLLEQARHVQSYAELSSLCRWHQKLVKRTPNPNQRKSVKVALLGGATTEMMEAPLVLALEVLGLGCEIFRSDYNTFAHEMLDNRSITAAFRPEVAVVMNCAVNIPSWPKVGDDLQRVKQITDEVCCYWIDLCAKFHEHTQCEVILNNFHLFDTAPLGNLGAKLPWDTNNFIRRVNRELGDRLPAYIHVNDVEWLSAKHGLMDWFDPRYWFHAKQPVSFDCLLPYVRNTARIIGALFGRSAKCLVLDLDNTLWGGVVGDDGPEGLVIGEGNPLGEAFKAFQEYLLKLKQRGVMLAVCSKNEESNALAAFEKRPEMVLKREDFVAFKANWLSKPENLREIAAELNIGLNTLVFVDDNPAEREYVRASLRDVKVVELSEDPADYPRLLDEAGLFETTAVSAEDQERTQKYHENFERARLQETAGDYTSYLASLRQTAVVRPFEQTQLDRITQLINKTNQFNLTTLRQSRSQVEAMMRDANVLTAYVRLKDRFGDNGLISVFFGHKEGEELWIDEWLMSCRVLKRGVEHLVCNYVAERACGLGMTRLHGVYIPTPANKLVCDHYQSLGFTARGAEPDGITHWLLDLAGYRPASVEIAVVEEY